MSDGGKQVVGRRTTLKLLGGTGIVGFAGCTGGGDGGDGGGDGSDGGGDGGGSTTTTASDGGATTTAGPDLEDELTVYAPTNIGPVARAFEEEFGVTVNDTVFPGPQVLAKFKSEAGAGEYNTSVVISAGGNLIWPSMRQYLQPVEDIEVNDKIWTDARRSLFEEAGGLGYGYPWATLIRGTPYNTNNVSEPPVTWDDLTDPQWEGSLISPPYNMERVYAILRIGGYSEEEARQYLSDLKPNIGSFQPGVPANVQKIIGGQADIGVQLMAFFVANPMSSGAPVDVTFPEFTSEHIEGAVLTKEAPAPKAGKKFIEWLISDAGQEAVQQDLGFNPAHVDMDHGTPAIAERLAKYEPEVHPLIYTTEEVSRKYDQIVKDTIGI